MVVILIVQGSNNGDLNAESPSFDNSKISNGRGERLSTTTNTTSVSFFSSSSSSLQVDPDNVLATTKEGKCISFLFLSLTGLFCSNSIYELKII